MLQHIALLSWLGVALAAPRWREVSANGSWPDPRFSHSAVVTPDGEMLLFGGNTLDASLFCSYYGAAPSLHIPGRTFAVSPLYLEDAIELVDHEVKQGAPWARKLAREHGGPRKGAPPPPPAGGGGKAVDESADENTLDFDALRARYPRHAPSTAP